MTRAAQGKSFPVKLEKAVPELFERETVDVKNLSPKLRELYTEQLQRDVNKKYQPR